MKETLANLHKLFLYWRRCNSRRKLMVILVTLTVFSDLMKILQKLGDESKKKSVSETFPSLHELFVGLNICTIAKQ